MHRRTECSGAGDGLLEEADAGGKRREPWFGSNAIEQLDHHLGAGALLVAIHGDGIVRRPSTQHRGDPHQPRHIGLRLTRNLDLEPAVPVPGDHLFQRLRQPVAKRRLELAIGQHVTEPDRVADGDRGGGRTRSKEGRQVKAIKIGCCRCRDTKPIFAHGYCCRDFLQPAYRIDHRPIHQSQPERCDQPIEPSRRAGRMMGRFQTGIEAERCAGASRSHARHGDAQ